MLSPQLPPDNALEDIVKLLSNPEDYKAKVEALIAHKKEIAAKTVELREVSKRNEEAIAGLREHQKALAAAKLEADEAHKTLDAKRADVDRRLSHVQAIMHAAGSVE